MRPAFDDPPLTHELRDGVPWIEAGAARDCDPVTALDGRDRVELDAHRSPDRSLDVVSARSADSRHVVLGPDVEAAERRQ